MPTPRQVIAVVLPSWVGDVVMATPALRAIRDARREARLIALARPGLRELLEGAGIVDDFVDDAMRGALGPLRAALALRRHAPQEIVLLPNSFRSAAMARLAGADHRIGYRTDGRGWLLTRAIAPPTRGRSAPVAAVDWYAGLVEQALETPVSDRRPHLAPTAAQRDAATKLLDGVARPFAVLNPGANREDKRWPADRFAAVGRALRERGLGVVVNGGPAERALAHEVAWSCDGIDLAARGVTLGALLGALADAALLVTNDTGPRHMAIGVGAPVVALFGPTDHRWTTVRGVRERLVLAEPFLPETEVADRRPTACRIERIAVGDVLAAAMSILAEHPRA